MFTVLAIEVWRVLDKVSNTLQYVALLLSVGGIVGAILGRRRGAEGVPEKRRTSTLMLFGAALAATVSAIAYAAELTVADGW